MALLFADGFETGTAAWSMNTNTSLTASGRFGNGVASTGGGSGISVGIAPNTNTIIVGFASKPTSSGGELVQLSYDNNPSISVNRGSGGEVFVERGFSTILSTSAVNVMPGNAWSYIELKTFIADSPSGNVTVRVNGVEVINSSGIDTKDSATIVSTNKVQFVVATSYVVDDVYICDNTGSVNNDFLGELMVEHMVPNSDDTSQWVGSDGNSVNNFDLVNETGPYNSSDYVASSTVGDRDLYLPTTSSRPVSSPVRGVIVSAIAQKTDAGIRTARLVIKEGAGGTVRTSSTMGLPTTFGELRALWDRKADGSAWTVADVNQLRFGMEVVS